MSFHKGSYQVHNKMTRSQRPDDQDRKREERKIREAFRQEHKIESYLADDQNFPSFSVQLTKIGLQLRDIPGDGNCLFRALGDQLEGHGRNHFKHRMAVVKYMFDNREDFEPFVEDDIPFDRYLQNLRKLGTYAGNDAIVAFSRCYVCNIIIHQLNASYIVIQGNSSPHTNQLHLAYHNGDHYSSVRKLHDNTESPANIRLQESSEASVCSWGNNKLKSPVSKYTADGGVVRAIRNPDRIEEDVINATGCQDIGKIRRVLLENNYDLDSTIVDLLQLIEISDSTSFSSENTLADSGIWMDNGMSRLQSNGVCNSTTLPCRGKTHSRDSSYGGSSGYGSIGSGGGARPKLNIKQNLSSKQKKELKKMEKKKRAEDRHKQKFGGQKNAKSEEDDSVVTIVSKDTPMMRV